MNRCYFVKRQDAAAGFTILELMIASMTFTVVLLVVAMGVVSFTNSYFKGITTAKTQAAARQIMESIVSSIQLSKSTITFPSSTTSTGMTVSGICIDNTLYSYVLGQEVVDVAPLQATHQWFHGLIQTSGNCSAGIPSDVTASLGGSGTLPPPFAANSRELLGPNMRIALLAVTPVSGVSNAYDVHLRVIYGDDDLMTPAVQRVPAATTWANELCGGNIAGSQFCAISDLQTTVQQRLLL